MTEEKILSPQTIEDTPFPQETLPISYGVTQSSSGGVSTTSNIKPQALPYKRVATEMIGSALNTKSRKILAEFEFTESGALQIGKYEPGVSGDLRLTPSGQVARNKAGITTFAIDGETGNIVVLGSIQSGSIITGDVKVGDGDIVIDGQAKRMIFYDPDTGLDSIIIGNA